MSKLLSQKTIYLLLFLIVLLAGLVRFYKIDTNPPGLYLDEASIGYNAYKILTTGHDEHGKKYPVFFQAFGEYKFPVYIYMTVASMDLFGKNEFAVRFSSAFFGTLTIPLVYLLTKKAVKFSSRKNEKVLLYGPLITALLLTLSPWHIQFSRAGFEANLALFFFVLGLDLFLIFIDSKKSGFLLILSFLFLGLNMYTYQAYRIITLITIIFCSIWIYREKRNSLIVLFSALLLLVFLCIPLLQFFLSPEGGIRFSQTSAFIDSNSMTFLQKIIVYPSIFIKNYISFYSTQFLFISGDGIGRHQVSNFGLIPLWEVIFIFVGFYSIYKDATNKKYVVFLLFFLSAIPASLARPSPHALRSLLMVVPLVIFATYGIILLCSSKVKFIKLCMIGVLLFAVYETALYFHFYYEHYPKTHELDWGGEYKELIHEISRYKRTYKYLVVDTRIGSSPIYFSFYDESLRPMYTDKIWKGPNELDKKDILFVGSSEKVSNIKILNTIYIKNKNHDIFGQIWIKK